MVEVGRAASRGGTHLQDERCYMDDTSDQRMWRGYAEACRGTPVSSPAPKPPKSDIPNNVAPRAPGNSSVNEGMSDHMNPSAASRSYVGYGPSTSTSQNAVHTKAASATKKHMWAALNPGGASSGPRADGTFNVKVTPKRVEWGPYGPPQGPAPAD